MIHKKLDSHTKFCREFVHSPVYRCSEREFCEKYDEKHLLFFIKDEFWLLTYYGCLEFGDHLKFKEDIFRQIYDAKVTEGWNLQKSVLIDDEFRKSRLRGTTLNTVIPMVIYMYSPREYGFTYNVKWENINEDTITKSYIEMKEYLSKIGLQALWGELEALYQINMTNTSLRDHVQVIKTTDNLLKEINHEISRQSNNKGVISPRI